MPRNSSGTYSLPAGNPVVSGTLIEASWANTTLSDLASAMTGSLSRAGEGGMTAALRLYDGTVSLPGLAFTNETSTGLYRAGSGDMRLAVTGSQVMQFLSTGVAVTGTLSASGNTTLSGTLAVTGATTLSSTLAVTGAATFSGQTVTLENSTAYYPQLINRNKTADANGSYIVLEKVRNTSVVQNGDVLGNVIFRGYDGASYLQGAYINAIISATPGTNDMPTDLVFGTTPDGSAGPTERMRIDQRGNLGLGVTPSAWSGYKVLQAGIGSFIGGSSGAYILSDNAYTDSSGASWKYINSSYAPAQYYAAAGAHVWRTAASGTAGNAITFTQAMTLNASGELLVGATSGTGARLHVNRLNANQNEPVVSWTDAQNNTGYLSVASSNELGENGACIYSDGALFFGRNISSTFTERARIDSSGNFLVYEPAALASAVGRFNAAATFTGSPISYFYASNGSFSNAVVRASMAGTSSSAQLFLGQNNNTTAVFYVQGNGTINSTSTSITGISDVRFKENIRDLDDGLSVVMALKPRKFDWKEGKGANIKNARGFIAQEFEQVLPDLIGEWLEEAPEGEEPYKSVRPDLIPTLVKAIQEQQAIITQLQADVAALKGQA